jgi:ribosomal protein S18 acetylase RimI-like enzyme
MIEIVKAKEEYITELGDLWMGFMRFHANMDPVYEPPDGAIHVYVDEYLRPAMTEKNSLVLAALDGQQVVGYSYSVIVEPHKLNKREKYGKIHDMFIAARYRRGGIGMRMFSEIAKWFHSNDINRIELDVMVRNQAASSFWEKLGFTDLNRTLYRNI